MARRKTGQWSKEEVGLLKKMFKNMSNRDVANALNRKEASVQYKAWELGLKKARKYLKSIGLAK